MVDITGWRKIIATIVVLAVGVFVTYTKGDVPPGLLQLLSVLFGGFILGNGIEHTTAIFANGKVVGATTDTPVSPPVDLQPVKNKLELQGQALAVIQQSLSHIITKAGMDK